jgi:hypothetical protein
MEGRNPARNISVFFVTISSPRRDHSLEARRRNDRSHSNTPAMSALQSNGTTTRRGGVTGAGFMPGVSGNPGGRPKGLARRVRELVGDDGEAIAVFMHEVMNDEGARTADRLEAARWLADRGFGRSVQALDTDVSKHPSIDVSKFATEDLDALIAIFEKYKPDAAQLAESGDLRLAAGPAPADCRRR